MKAYGLPRDPAVEHPDCADAVAFARASRVGGNLPGISGDTHSIFRSSSVKARARRIFKKRERRAAKRLIRAEVY